MEWPEGVNISYYHGPYAHKGYIRLVENYIEGILPVQGENEAGYLYSSISRLMRYPYTLGNADCKTCSAYCCKYFDLFEHRYKAKQLKAWGERECHLLRQNRCSIWNKSDRPQVCAMYSCHGLGAFVQQMEGIIKRKFEEAGKNNEDLYDVVEILFMHIANSVHNFADITAALKSGNLNLNDEMQDHAHEYIKGYIHDRLLVILILLDVIKKFDYINDTASHLKFELSHSLSFAGMLHMKEAVDLLLSLPGRSKMAIQMKKQFNGILCFIC